jgi:bifunctional non-homologous end joining protein LigD
VARWRENPSNLKPMLAALDTPPVEQRGLVYEPKYDGIRALADVRPPARHGGAPSVKIYSRNGRDKHAQFPAIAEAFATLAATLEGPILVDGEIVAIDASGAPLGFQHIQGRIHLSAAGEIARAEAAQPAVFIAFDLLRDDEEDLRGLPFAARRLRLQEKIRPSRRGPQTLRLSEIATDDGRAMLERAKKERWEGLIVKDGHSPYHSGRRTPAWRKLKLQNEQEFVIGGWTEPRDTRPHFGALILGYYDQRGLRWAGSVGTGFSDAELARLAGLLTARRRATSPFVDEVSTLEIAHWIRPDLVAQIRFTEWTSDGMLRHPVYLGLRADKRATAVRREAAAVAPAPPKVPLTKSGRARRTAGARARPVQTRRSPLDAVVEEISTLEDARKDGEIALPNGDRLRVTNLAKKFWPDLGITKGELLRYYVQVSPLLLPVIDDRPLVMRRFPNGIGGQAFYQQRHPEAPPPGVRREVLPEDVEPIEEDGPRDRLIGGSLTTLLYMTQLASISQDPWFSRVVDPLHQDYAAIDLDPGDDAPFRRVVDVALWVKEALDAYDIPACAKTSGASGLHIYIPLPSRTSYETGQLLCQMIASTVADAHPKVATIERMVKKRPRGTVYVDYLQNILGKTLATAYSARASDYAGVSTPLRWEEVNPSLDPRDFTIRTALARFRDAGDLWSRLRKHRPVNLTRLVGRAR